MNERRINTGRRGAAINTSDKFEEIDRLRCAGLDVSIRRDQFGRDVWFPAIWFGQGYFADRYEVFRSLRPYQRNDLILRIGLLSVLAAIALVNDMPINLTNGILFAAPFLLLAMLGIAIRQSVAENLWLIPSPLRIRFRQVFPGLNHDNMPTGLLCILLPVYALIAIACIAALYLGGLDWRFTLACAFMTLLSASIGRTLYTRGKDL